jgi:hypothetical protein
LAIWFSHSSQAASALGRTLGREWRTIKPACSAAYPVAPGEVEPSGKTRTRWPQQIPTRLEGSALVATLAASPGPRTSGVLHQTAGVITDFSAGYAVLGCRDRLAHPTSAELRTAPVRRNSWPAGWCPIYLPIPARLPLGKAAGTPPKLTAAGPRVKVSQGLR